MSLQFNSRDWVLKPVSFPRNARENYSGKINLPSSILRDLAIFNFPTPYIFEISHSNEILKTICAVNEFTAPSAEVMVPQWMFNQLNLENSNEVYISFVRIPRGKGIKLLPHSVDFLELENPKLCLEQGLIDYPCVSVGDEIKMKLEDYPSMSFTIVSVIPKQHNAVYIVDTDLNVDFDEAIGYKQKIESEKTVIKYISVEKDRTIKGSNKKDNNDERDEVKEISVQGLSLLLNFDEFNKKFNE